jgi:hypothetical protein
LIFPHASYAAKAALVVVVYSARNLSAFLSASANFAFDGPARLNDWPPFVAEPLPASQ